MFYIRPCLISRQSMTRSLRYVLARFVVVSGKAIGPSMIGADVMIRSANSTPPKTGSSKARLFWRCPATRNVFVAAEKGRIWSITRKPPVRSLDLLHNGCCSGMYPTGRQLQGSAIVGTLLDMRVALAILFVRSKTRPRKTANNDRGGTEQSSGLGGRTALGAQIYTGALLDVGVSA